MKSPSLLLALATALALCGCALPLDPNAPDGLALDCALPSNCVTTLNGRSEPLHFAGDDADAMARLRRTLAGYADARVVRSDATSIVAIFTTPAGFEDEVVFRIDVSRRLIDYRSRSRIGLFDFGKNRSRMREFAERFAATSG